MVSVGTSTAKDLIYGRLGIDDATRPGYIHFPLDSEAGCDAEYFQHLTAEKLVTRQTKGGEISRWENPHKRNEALDCAVYALAAKEFTRAPLRELARKLEAKAARLPPDQRPGTTGHAVGQVAAKLLSSLSQASSAASPSPRTNSSKKRRKSIVRPGFGWINGK